MLVEIAFALLFPARTKATTLKRQTVRLPLEVN
jgi:hypothetical protein